MREVIAPFYAAPRLACRPSVAWRAGDDRQSAPDGAGGGPL